MEKLVKLIIVWYNLYVNFVERKIFVENKEILNVRIDLKKGVYVITSNNGGEVIKPIKENGKIIYDRKAIESRRMEIRGRKGVPSQILKQLDPILYDALAEFDMKYGTNYGTSYFEATTKQIPYAGLSEKARDYKARAKEIRNKMLRDAGINIESNSTLIGHIRNLDIGNKVQTLRNAVLQKGRDGRGELNNRRKPIHKTTPAQIVIEDNDIPDMPGRDEISSDILLNTGVSYEIGKPKKEEKHQPMRLNTNKQEPAKEKMKRCKRIQAAKKAEREARKYKNMHKAKVLAKERERLELEAKRKAEEEAARLAEEKARIAREQEEKARREKEERKLTVRLRRKYESIRSKLHGPNLTKQKKQVEEAIENVKTSVKKQAEKITLRLNRRQLEKDSTKSKRDLKNKAITIRKKLRIPNLIEQKKKIRGAIDTKISEVQSKAEVLNTKMDEKREQVGEQVIRLKRTLKDKSDSIKNKVHVPEVTVNKRIIMRAASMAAVALLLGVGIKQFTANTNPTTPKDQIPTEGVVEIIKNTNPKAEEIIKKAYHKTEGAIKKDIQANKESANTQTQMQEKSEKDSSVEYLSSIKVGSTIKIDSGRFYETPEGTGRSGSFERYQDGVKEITIIGIATNDGYVVIKDANVNLHELKQKYPNGKFSYHFVCKQKDGRTTALGWLTENSFEQNINMRPQTADMER